MSEAAKLKEQSGERETKRRIIYVIYVLTEDVLSLFSQSE